MRILKGLNPRSVCKKVTSPGSTGDKFENPGNYRKAQKALCGAQRKVARRNTGSQRGRQAVGFVAKVSPAGIPSAPGPATQTRVAGGRQVRKDFCRRPERFWSCRRKAFESSTGRPGGRPCWRSWRTERKELLASLRNLPPEKHHSVARVGRRRRRCCQTESTSVGNEISSASATR